MQFPLPLSLKSWRYFVDIRSVEENYRFRKPYFTALGRERDKGAVGNP
jgi:hypothetical protein